MILRLCNNMQIKEIFLNRNVFLNLAHKLFFVNYYILIENLHVNLTEYKLISSVNCIY